MTSVFVTTTPTLPVCPVLGMFIPRSAGLLRIASGVSPCGVDHSSVPLSRLMPTTTPYGGFRIGRPWTIVPAPPKPSPPPPRPPPAPPRPAPPRPASAAPAVVVAGGGGGGGAPPPRWGCGASAAEPSPPPR